MVEENRGMNQALLQNPLISMRDYEESCYLPSYLQSCLDYDSSTFQDITRYIKMDNRQYAESQSYATNLCSSPCISSPSTPLNDSGYGTPTMETPPQRPKNQIGEEKKRYYKDYRQMCHLQNGRNRTGNSYISMIAKCILLSKDHKCSIEDIYSYIEKYHPEYRCSYRGWRSSVRYTLSVQTCFIKGEHVKNKRGNFWYISPCYLEQFKRGDFSNVFRSRLRKNRHQQNNFATCELKNSIPGPYS